MSWRPRSLRTTEHRRRAKDEDRVLCEITLSVNAVGEPGPKSIAALDGLGEIAFRGSILPEHAVTILQIIEGTLRADVDGAGDAAEVEAV